MPYGGPDALSFPQRFIRHLSREAGVWLWSLDGRTGELVIHGDMAELLGAQPRTLDDLLRLISPSDAGAFGSTLRTALERGEGGAFEGCLTTTAGARMCFHISYCAEVGPQGQVVLYGASRDITAETLSREAAEEARRKAEASSEAKSAFLATVSHEIRTPLNGVLGMAQAMARHELSDSQRKRLRLIQTAGETLLSLLNDVLDISKIEAGRIEIEDALVQVEDIVATAQGIFAGLGVEKGLELSVEVAPDLPRAWRGDPVRVRQIVQNLVSNAVKFTARGSVRVSLGRDEQGLVLVVADTGPGIRPEMRTRIFDRFIQEDVSTTRRHGGTGLGLSICRELARLMGGDIRLESRMGKGSTFTVSLPLAPADGADLGDPAAEPALALADTPELRVLAAEDNPVNQIVLRTLLEQAGIDPEMVADGEAAIRAWETGRWDVILMDVQMPVMDGLAATRHIRRREREAGLAPTPIIALTANAMTHQADEYRAAGMDAVVSKPIRVDELLAALARVVEGPQDRPLSGVG